MMGDPKRFVLVSEGKRTGELYMQLSEMERPARIFVLDGPSYLKSEYDGEDYFYALVALRLDLEKEGVFVACYGNLRSVYPSGMSADMSNGLIAYSTEGESLIKVNIFDEVPVEKYKYLDTVMEQKELRRALVRTGKIRRMGNETNNR